MKVCVIGATGLLGYQGARELIGRGHKIVGLALAPVPEGLEIPREMELKLGNFMEMSDTELRGVLTGCDGLVFAAGVDERVEGKPPIYDLYKKYNIDALDRVLGVAVKAEVKKVVVLGSYFSYFAKEWPRMELTKYHPYIRSRMEQEKVAFGYADGEVSVAVLELPYIFGAQRGRKPVWLFVAEMIRKNKTKTLFYPKGGTTMVTVRQVGECIAGALERVEGAKAYPVGWYNMTWKEWLGKFSSGMGAPKKIVSVPNFLYKFAARGIMREARGKGLEPGLEMVRFADVMTAKTYIDKRVIRDELGVRADDIDAAIRESARVSAEISDNPERQVVDMRAK